MMTCGELMTPSPSCCRGDVTVDQAAEMMKQDDVGLVPVVSDSLKLIGVITDRDIAIKIVADHRDPHATTVSEVMTPAPIYCRPHESTETLMEVMASNQIRRVPIVDDDGVILGIVAQADLATRLGRPEQTGQVVQAISNDETVTAASIDMR